MEIVQSTKLSPAQREVKSHDGTIMLSYLVSLSSGTAPGDFATMTVFP
jgi:hypothetical protein